MANILGSVPISGFVAPTAETDVYPSHKAVYGHGGYRTVATIVDRDAITEQRREEGMQVYVLEDGVTYMLKGGITNLDWDSSGGSASNVSITSVSTSSVVDARSQTILVDATEDVVLTLPNAVDCFSNGQSLKVGITRIDATTNVVEIVTAGGSIMRQSSMKLYSLEVVNFITDGTNWWLGA